MLQSSKELVSMIQTDGSPTFSNLNIFWHHSTQTILNHAYCTVCDFSVHAYNLEYKLDVNHVVASELTYTCSHDHGVFIDWRKCDIEVLISIVSYFVLIRSCLKSFFSPTITVIGKPNSQLATFCQLNSKSSQLQQKYSSN